MSASGSQRSPMAASLLKMIAVTGLGLSVATAAAPDIQAMNQPHKPFRIYGNTYYVGMTAISSVLITSDYGHVLVDAGLPESAPLIARNIQELGFKLQDVKGIVFSHPHPDHVGGIAELQRLTGAQVYGLRGAEEVLRTGKLAKDDPQYSAKSSLPKASSWVVTDGQLLGIGQLRLRVYATPGHTTSSATWTWDACEGSKCLPFVYADSFSAVSSGKYKFKDHPEAVAAFKASLAKVGALSCDILLTPHAEPGVLDKLEAAKGNADAVKDDGACKRFSQQRLEALEKRLADER
jgi:metallo-beta-lactamase class B